MTRRFVFEADIIVPRLELHRQRYEISLEVMRELLGKLSSSDNELNITAEELDELLSGPGTTEICNFVRTANKEASVRKLVAALSKAAWQEELPWKLDQAEGYGIGDEQFHEYLRAYIMPDEDHPLGSGD